MGRTTEQIRQAWAPACRIQWAQFRFWTGVTIPVDARILAALAGLDSQLKRWAYRPKGGQTFGYACRRITGGTDYSLHAYGVAIDVNSLSNPYGSTLVTDMPRPMVDAIKAIRTTQGLPVWRWGGDYAGNKDAMHYEIEASPAELAAGIVSPDVPAPAPSWKWTDHMPKPTEFTSACHDPVSGGWWAQTAEGGVDGHTGATVKESYKDHPELGGGIRYFVAIVPSPTLPGGFCQIANDGALYNWPPKP